jgi:hypothetical protein
MKYSKNIKIFIVLLIAVICVMQCDVPRKDKNAEKSPSSGLSQEKNLQKSITKKPESSSIEHSKFPMDSIMGIWAVDPNGPHADFEINKNYYFLVDYEGDANMIYIIINDTIVVYLKDIISRGIISKACSDSLQIVWDNQENTTYVRWKK